MPKATHWTPTDNPEDWKDNPLADPVAAARQHIEDHDDASWDDRNELERQGSTLITLYGYIETNAPLDEQHAFDGYEPGDSYFAPTGETIKVKASVHYEVMP